MLIEVVTNTLSRRALHLFLVCFKAVYIKHIHTKHEKKTQINDYVQSDVKVQSLSEQKQPQKNVIKSWGPSGRRMPPNELLLVSMGP